ncbi:hypothetical protein QBC35DRAFT_421221 [Podospora australis]|uniref:Uncharacterized protein n=1 Tax=Podospora australis TaxID=1536484 RepID=A0AAN6WKP4_9PEZI|nr:hypothetical protein QBC35DRAFT_421221 [Podospora australis]
MCESPQPPTPVVGTSEVEPTTLSSIAASLSAGQKSRLQSVADGLLTIYQTLIRMGFLHHSWLFSGPHDDAISPLVPMFLKNDIDPRIIYLYSILPYIRHHRDNSSQPLFFQGSEFFELRYIDEGALQQSRQPFYSEDPQDKLRPWMTCLATLGNHGTIMVYDAKRHTVGLHDQESTGSEASTDHWFMPQDRSGDEMVEDEQEEMSGDDDDDEVENNWDQSPARPARAVLRDINTWFETLLECPSGGSTWILDYSSFNELHMSDLLRKHGWPSPKFDRDAFLVDAIRAEAACRAKDNAEQTLRTHAERKSGMEYWRNEVGKQRKAADEATTTEDEKWTAKWNLFQAERNLRVFERDVENAKEELERKCPGGVCQLPEELPLWELRELRKHAPPEVKDDGEEERNQPPSDRIMTLEEEKDALYRRAYEASKADAARLCPGRNHPTGYENDDGIRWARSHADILREMAPRLVTAETEVTDTKEWLRQLPGSIDLPKTRELVQSWLDHHVLSAKDWAEQKEALELVIAGEKPAGYFTEVRVAQFKKKEELREIAREKEKRKWEEEQQKMEQEKRQKVAEESAA